MFIYNEFLGGWHKGHDLVRMRHFNNWTEITCGSREQINSINGIFNTHKDLITARGKKKISHLWKISNFKWHTLTWGPNLCSAVSGWVSLKTRTHTRGGCWNTRACTRTQTHTHTLFLSASLSPFLIEKQTDMHAATVRVVRQDSGQINWLLPQAFSIIALDP